MKIGFASVDWAVSVFDDKGHPEMGGSGWARLGQYKDALPFDVVIGSPAFCDGLFGVQDWHENNHFDCDVVYLQRAMFDDIAERILEARANGQIIINDVDDWYWGLSTANSAFYSTHPRNNPKENVNHYRSILANSDVVTVSTPYLAKRLEAWVSCPIIVLPNTVDVGKFKPVEITDTNVPTVGWVGSTAHRSNDLEIMRGILRPFVESGKIKLHHSGHFELHPLFSDGVGVDAAHVSVSGMAAPAEYPSLFTFEVGLVPLSNKPFNQAKSAIKGLEYSASGIPFIASGTDSYAEIHDAGMGILATKPRHWISHLERMRNPEFRLEHSKRALEAVKQYDISVGVQRMTDFFATFDR